VRGERDRVCTSNISHLSQQPETSLNVIMHQYIHISNLLQVSPMYFVTSDSGCRDLLGWTLHKFMSNGSRLLMVSQIKPSASRLSAAALESTVLHRSALRWHCSPAPEDSLKASQGFSTFSLKAKYAYRFQE